MLKDERDLLDVLKFELEFLNKRGYGRSPREPWRARFVFEDSPTCMNYDSKDHPDSCDACVLMQLVPSECRAGEIPCRYIPLNAEGQTLDSLYRCGDQNEIEVVFGNWLRVTIEKLEEERRMHRDNLIEVSVSGANGGEGEPLFDGQHPKCANPGCPTAFHWLGGGKFFRFRPDPAASRAKGQVTQSSPETQGVKHYWLCERCSHMFFLAYDENQGVVLKFLRPDASSGKSPQQLTTAH